MAKVTLFNGLTGLSTIVDAGGQGLRGKTWLDELSGFAHEAAEPANLAGIGLGRLANFSAIVDGQKMGTKPLGEDYSTPAYDGVDLFDVIRNSVQFGLGDGALTAWGGSVGLTEPDRTHANYFNTTTDPDDPVAPVNAQAGPFLQSISDAAGDFDFAATVIGGTLTLRVNGVLFSITGIVDETAAELAARITASAMPVTALESADNNTVRIFASGLGVTSSIEAVVTATDAGSVLFTGAGASSQPDVVYLGTGSPLGDMSHDAGSSGGKVQRRILPGSVIVTATVTAALVTLTDDRAGVLSTLDGLHTGTIDYATGAIALTFGTAPDNATAINANWKVLYPKDLSSEVRLPEGSVGPVDGRPVVEMALILK